MYWVPVFLKRVYKRRSLGCLNRNEIQIVDKIQLKTHTTLSYRQVNSIPVGQEGRRKQLFR